MKIKKPARSDAKYWNGEIFDQEAYHQDLKKYLCAKGKDREQ